MISGRAHQSSHAYEINEIHLRSPIKIDFNAIEEEEELQTEDLRTLKVLRDNAKRRFANLIKVAQDFDGRSWQSDINNE
jgi:hypothetical protein